MERNRTRASKANRGPFDGLSRSGDVWEGDFFYAAELEDEPAPGPEPEVLLVWVDAATGVPLAIEIGPRADAERALADLLVETMRRPRRPAAVAVRRPRVERLVRERVRGMGIEVRLEPELDAWDQAMVHVLGLLAAHAPDRRYLDGEGATPAAVERLFRAAAACYRDTPWDALPAWTPVELEMPGLRAPVFIAARHDRAGPAIGIALPAADAPGPRSRGRVPLGKHLYLSFQPSDDVPDAMLEEQRAHGWPLAHPDAFPLLHFDITADEPGEASGAELELLAAAIAALTAFLVRHRDAVESSAVVSDTVDVGDVVGRRFPVRVTFPPAAERDAIWDWLDAVREQDAADDEPADDDPRALVDEMRLRVTALPHVASVLDRLAWSFFRAARPWYLPEDHEDEIDEAVLRFLEWAYFFARVRPGGRTLAEEALDLAARGLSPAELAERERVVHPRYSVYDVVAVEPGRGFTLRDLADGETLRVSEPLRSLDVRQGWTLLGAAYPAPGGTHVLGSVTALRAWPRGREGLGDADAGTAAAAIEKTLHGADLSWIDAIDSRRELRRAYHEFRNALGEPLPAYAALERLVRKADSPEDVTARATRGVHWWTDVEQEIFGEFIGRTRELVCPGGWGGRAQA